MEHIRPAETRDLARIAEIEIFNYRLHFFPIFQNDRFYFDELQVPAKMEQYAPLLDQLWVYDDGVVKGFCQAQDGQLKKLFVEPVLQGQAIGARLLDFAVTRQKAHYLWALEKNTRAIAFYERHGFHITADRQPEEDTDEYLVRLER